MIDLAQIIEPRVASPIPAIHLFATIFAAAWAGHHRRYRPPTPAVWRIAMWTTGFAAAGDALLVLSAWSSGLVVIAYTIAFILGLALLMMSLLQGWPSKPLLVVGALAVVAPFLLWL